ncbi:hypothetical protein MLD38_009753 [Melastoma candidum]|uniref:Uncharacterized protein n=1 Tax=Melastoma candidum TaxID=119954 RepID=A0ACB9S1M3_9MYRT|nr:hypothetical protein MLD38_009753 [Melastoma candidum]
MMSAGELESGNDGEPTIIRRWYREAAYIIKKGKMCYLFINDLDAFPSRLGRTTQYTVHNQMFMVNFTLMNIADNLTNLQLPGMSDNIPEEAVVKLVGTFPGQSIDFFGDLRSRIYDDDVRKWVSRVGVESIGKKLVNSKEGLPAFEQPKITLAKLLEYQNMLVQEQENVKRVQLADKYLSESALGKANKDSIACGAFFG